MGAVSRVNITIPAAMAGAALAACLLYANTLPNQFAFDDLEIVVRNPLVTGSEAFDLTKTFSRHYWHHLNEAGNLYRPLTILSYAFNHAVSGLAAWSYHAVNILLHALASALVVLIAARLRMTAGQALAAGLLFAAHPVHTEAVAGVVGRAELLSACGVLGAWALHLGTAGGSGRAAAVGALFAAGLFSKENAIVLPALMLAGDLCLTRAGASPAPRRRLAPSYAACLAAALIWMAARAAALPDMSDPGLSDSPLAGTPATHRLLTALHVTARYAALLIAPVILSADYSWHQIPIVSSPDLLAVMGSLALGAVAAAAAIGLARGRSWGLAAAGFLIAFAPVSNLAISIGTLMAERLLYLPSVFFCLSLPAAWGALSARARHPGGRAWGPAAMALTAAAVVAGGIRTVARNADWRDQLTLFTATVRTSPRSASAHYNLGVALEEAGRPAEALDQYLEAVTIRPEDRRAQHNAGLLLASGGRLEEAARRLELALALDPDLASAAASLGAVYSRLGQQARAESVLRSALLRNPAGDERRRLLYNLGSLLLERGRASDAIPLLEEARALDGSDPDTRYHLGLAYMQTGRHAEAREEMRRALELSPDLVEAHVQIGLASLRLGDSAAAAAAAKRARAAGMALPEELAALAP